MRWTHYRAQVASLTRSRTPDDPELIEAKNKLAVAFVEEKITKAVQSAPPLPDDVADRLTRIIRSATGAHRAVAA